MLDFYSRSDASHYTSLPFIFVIAKQDKEQQRTPWAKLVQIDTRLIAYKVHEFYLDMSQKSLESQFFRALSKIDFLVFADSYHSSLADETTKSQPVAPVVWPDTEL